MDSNFKDGSCYINGVPIKISPKFWPPKHVSLPLPLDTTAVSDLLAEQYDFSLERNVIEYTEKHQTELLKKKSGNSSGSNACNNLQDNEPKNVLKLNSQPCILASYSILQPKLQQPPDKDPGANQDNNNIKINLSDFENDTSSPFDYMELQSINDLEELNSVFQGIHNESSSEAVALNENSADATLRTDGALNVAKSVSFPLPQNSPSESTKIPSSHSEDFMKQSSMPSARDDLSYVAKSINFQLSQNDTAVNPSNNEEFIKRPSLPNILDNVSCDNPFTNLKDMRGFSCDDSSYSTLSQVPYISSSNATSYGAISLRGSKSYSDIHSLSEIENHNVLKERSLTPPMSYSEAVVSPVKELPLNEKYFGDDSSNKVSNCDRSAYDELDEASRHFVDCITEMGFAKGQVARAVKHMGMDEKKVVEHLCQIQLLEESGYESSEAEAALHLHDYNREQAKAFLDLVIRFQDLGFEKDAVKKALVQNKNDWNKTIDALLS